MRTTFVSPVASRLGTDLLLTRLLRQDLNPRAFSESLRALLAHYLYMQFVLTFGDSPALVLYFNQMLENDFIVDE